MRARWLWWTVGVGLCACGPRVSPGIIEPDDAGVDAGVDAGRPRGDDPATGWQTAVEASDAGRLGTNVSSAPDRYGQPVLASLYVDPNGDGQEGDSAVYFTRWNGTEKKFQAFKRVEVVGEVMVSGRPSRQVSVAIDPVTQRVAIAYVKAPGEIRLATSEDDGENFSLQTASAGSSLVFSPQLAMRANVMHLAFIQDGTLVYRKRTGVTGVFSEETAPTPAGMSKVIEVPPALALDAMGNPGVAYFAADPTALTATLVFWRPGSTTATAVASSEGFEVLQPATPALRMPGVALTFTAELPRLAYHLRKAAPLSTEDNTTELFFAAASDAAGQTWVAPQPIQRNGYQGGAPGVTYHSTRWYQAVVASPTRQAVAAFHREFGTIGQCRGPKLARSTTGSDFMTCSPTGSPFGFAGEWVTMWEYAPGKLQVFFNWDEAASAGELKRGIISWREP